MTPLGWQKVVWHLRVFAVVLEHVVTRAIGHVVDAQRCLEPVDGLLRDISLSFSMSTHTRYVILEGNRLRLSADWNEVMHGPILASPILSQVSVSSSGTGTSALGLQMQANEYIDLGKHLPRSPEAARAAPVFWRGKHR